MISILLLFLFASIKSRTLPIKTCIAYYSQFQENNILNKIKSNSPQLVTQKINNLYYDICYCADGEYPRGNDILAAFTYKRMLIYLFRNEKDLTNIYKKFCNNGKEESIKACLNILGTNYNCDALIRIFGECVIDSSDPNKYF